MSWIRLLTCLAIAWTITAIGYNSIKMRSEAAPAPNFFVPKPYLFDAIALGNASRAESGKTALIDRTTGSQQPVELPRDLTWDLVSVSPWCDPDGRPEAVGRWAGHATEDGSEPFCGLGLFRLPDASPTIRVAIDVLPTGRACFVPGRVGDLLFPAGDGQLYRCTIGREVGGGESADPARSDVTEVHEPATVRPLAWGCPAPADGKVFIRDPAWPSEPKLRNLVFVALSVQKRTGRRPFFEPPKLWWLEVDDSGDTIRRAGPLTRALSSESEVDMTAERFPTVVARQEGKLGLVYLSQPPRERLTQLRWARLDVDPKTGVPQMTVSETLNDSTERAVNLTPPVISADGRSVFAASGVDRVVRFAIPEAG